MSTFDIAKMVLVLIFYFIFYISLHFNNLKKINILRFLELGHILNSHWNFCIWHEQYLNFVLKVDCVVYTLIGKLKCLFFNNFLVTYNFCCPINLVIVSFNCQRAHIMELVDTWICRRYRACVSIIFHLNSMVRTNNI